MLGYYWLVFASLLGLLASSLSQDTCTQSSLEFIMTVRDAIPNFCQQIQHRFNDISYRIDFRQSVVNDICNSDVCKSALQLLTLPCARFVSLQNERMRSVQFCGFFVQAKKDLNCLDSPAILTSVLCHPSNSDSTMRCYTSLDNQGVINSPYLVSVLRFYVYIIISN